MAGTLYLIPTPLGDGDTPWLPEGERARVTHISHFVVEAEKTARKHLSWYLEEAGALTHRAAILDRFHRHHRLGGNGLAFQGGGG